MCFTYGVFLQQSSNQNEILHTRDNTRGRNAIKHAHTEWRQKKVKKGCRVYNQVHKLTGMSAVSCLWKSYHQNVEKTKGRKNCPRHLKKTFRATGKYVFVGVPYFQKPANIAGEVKQKYHRQCQAQNFKNRRKIIDLISYIY